MRKCYTCKKEKPIREYTRKEADSGYKADDFSVCNDCAMITERRVKNAD